YIYKPLRNNYIRLLHLEPGNFGDSLQGQLIHYTHRASTRAYEALSYCWGNPRQISKNGLYIKGDNGEINCIPITPNLEDALRHLRSPHLTRTLWVDAICINQQHLAEKTRQIARMSKAYEGASRVLVWLGHANETTAYGMDILQYIINRPDRTFAPPWAAEVRSSPMAGIIDLLSRQWFERTWVVQETTLAHIVTIICGNETVSWPAYDVDILRRIRKLAQFSVVSPKWAQAGLSDATLDPFISILERQLIHRNSALSHGNFLDQNQGDLLDHMYDTRHKHTSNPHDKIYALQSIVKYTPTGLPFRPDYSQSVEKTYDRLYAEFRLWNNTTALYPPRSENAGSVGIGGHQVSWLQ
ncbi:HET-domain-containing protein, partial [Cenococcum geophilum 1.58]|uniref:HET-domain-containing protein n=1 Tax=Cenococcum geophilum 1.58 TaxID=794803 RepID=UPI00358F8143